MIACEEAHRLVLDNDRHEPWQAKVSGLVFPVFSPAIRLSAAATLAGRTE